MSVQWRQSWRPVKKTEQPFERGEDVWNPNICQDAQETFEYSRI